MLAEPFDVAATTSSRWRSSRSTARSSSSCSTRTPTRRGGFELVRAEARDPRRDEDLRSEDRPRPRARRLLARRHGRRAGLHSRAERLRQDDAALGDVRAARAHPRRASSSTARPIDGPRPAGDRDDLPGREPAALAQPAQEHRVPVRDQEASPSTDARIETLLEEVGLTEFEQLDAARALGRHAAARLDRPRARARTPGCCCMDEPFGALDAFTRDEMNLLLLRLWRRAARRSSSSRTTSPRRSSSPTASSC